MKYYFDNTQGLKNYLADMEAVGITPSHGQWMTWYGNDYTWHRSEFLDKMHYYDPDAEITHDVNDKDAVRLVEICSVGDPELLGRLLDRIELTKNTILYSATEPFYNSPRIQEKYNVKVISCASHLIEQPKKLAFTSYVLPFVLGQGLAQWSLPEPDVDRWFAADKSYKFLTVNSRFNYGRFALLLHLAYHNLIGSANSDPTRGQVAFNYNHLINLESLGKNTNTSDELVNINNYLAQFSELSPLGQQLLANKTALTLPELTDCPYRFTNNAPPHNPDWYTKSWFSIVCECNQRPKINGYFMSEKITKSILHGHPFMVYGDGGQLHWLSSIGFDTFEWLFGSDIDDPNGDHWLKTKLDNIVSAVKSVNADTFLSEQQRIKDAILHNYRHLHSDNLRQQAVNDWRRIINYMVE